MKFYHMKRKWSTHVKEDRGSGLGFLEFYLEITLLIIINGDTLFKS